LPAWAFASALLSKYDSGSPFASCFKAGTKRAGKGDTSDSAAAGGMIRLKNGQIQF
jgi:hypothetical protein